MRETGQPAWMPTLAAPLLAVTAMLIILIAFAWPASRLALRDLPVALPGDVPAGAEAMQRLEAAGFDVQVVPSEGAARDAIMNREVYGAIVIEGSPRVLTASAASPAVAQALPAVAARALGTDAVPAEDVRAAPADDPRGLGFAIGILPLIITSIAAAGLLGALVPTPVWRAAGAVVFAVVGGAAATGIIQGWFGSLDGDYLANAAVITTTLAALTFALLGLQAVAGRVGLGIGAAIMILLGNPLSAATSAPELLPEPWGAIGQLLAPGAGVAATRSVAFFDGAGASTAWIVLITWIAIGGMLLGLAALRRTAAEPIRAGLAGAR